jgi:hypothetical protein
LHSDEYVGCNGRAQRNGIAGHGYDDVGRAHQRLHSIDDDATLQAAAAATTKYRSAIW